MSLRSTFTGLALGIAAVATSPFVAAENLLDIYSQAQQNDPSYQAGLHQHAASSEVYFQARSALLPSANLTAMHSETDQEIVSSDNTLFQKGSDDFPTDRYEFSLTQSVYSYTNWKRFDKAKEDIKRIDAERIALEQNLLLRVAERYFAALAVQEDQASIASEMLAVKQHLTLVEARRKSGQARKTDLLDAQARHMQTLSRELEIRSRFRDSLEMLREMTGQSPEGLILVGNDLPLAKPEPAEPGAWYSQAKEFNPEIMVRKFALKAANKEVKARRGDHYPTLNLEASFSSEEKDGTVFGGGSEVEETVLALNFNMPLYSGGMVSSRVRESVQLYNQAKDQLELEQRAVQRQTFSAFDGVLTDISKVEALQKSVEAYELAAAAKSIGFESGLVNSLTVLDAERDLFFARSEYARARYGYILNRLRLKRAVGLLSLQDLEGINQHLTGKEIKVSFYAPVPQ
ncbi:MAG: TolC family outer membrane protein [Gammaproteobacteria bacterium]|nr:TolC family outer membrane protein [Gammaproteobacteria bacterium]MBQ0838849.1 TolC family outer membrane protein [Gammaproteobacteria bacterium]